MPLEEQMQGPASATAGEFNRDLSDDSAAMFCRDVRVHVGGTSSEDFPSLRHKFCLEHRARGRRKLDGKTLAPLRVGALRRVAGLQDLAGGDTVCAADGEAHLPVRRKQAPPRQRGVVLARTAAAPAATAAVFAIVAVLRPEDLHASPFPQHEKADRAADPPRQGTWRPSSIFRR